MTLASVKPGIWETGGAGYCIHGKARHHGVQWQEQGEENQSFSWRAGERNTVEHLFVDCSKYESQRGRLLCILFFFSLFFLSRRKRTCPRESCPNCSERLLLTDAWIELRCYSNNVIFINQQAGNFLSNRAPLQAITFSRWCKKHYGISDESQRQRGTGD